MFALYVLLVFVGVLAGVSVLSDLINPEPPPNIRWVNYRGYRIVRDLDTGLLWVQSGKDRRIVKDIFAAYSFIDYEKLLDVGK